MNDNNVTMTCNMGWYLHHINYCVRCHLVTLPVTFWGSDLILGRRGLVYCPSGWSLCDLCRSSEKHITYPMFVLIFAKFWLDPVCRDRIIYLGFAHAQCIIALLALHFITTVLSPLQCTKLPMVALWTGL